MKKSYTTYKVVITDFRRNGSKVDYANAFELCFYDEHGINIARVDGITTDASSWHPGSEPRYLFDGNLNTGWHAEWSGAVASYTNWVQIELPEPKTAVSFGWIGGNNSGDYPVDFTVQASNDGKRWDIIGDFTGYSSGWANKVERKFDLNVPEVEFFLLRDVDTFYTIEDSELVELDIEAPTAVDFQERGFQLPVAGELVNVLSSVELLRWTPSDSPSQIKATLEPYPQTIYSEDYDMTDKSIFGIETAIVDASEDVLFAISVDSGETWKYYKDGTWLTLSESNSGMTASAMNMVPTVAWEEIAVTGHYMIRAYLPSLDSEIRSVVIDYLNV